MRRCQLLIVCLFVLAVGANAQTASDVHVKLSLAQNKTTYRIGEPIGLALDFSAEREGYWVEYLSDGQSEKSDIVNISPETGVTHWFDEMRDNRYVRDAMSVRKLTGTPWRFELAINDTLRFDSPGRYTVSISTRCVSQKGQRKTLYLRTNSVTFEVTAMSESEEAEEVARIVDLLATWRERKGEVNPVAQLSYLTGEPSAREKVRRFINPEPRFGNYLGQISSGLFIARDRALVLKLIEAALRDPNIATTAQMIEVAARLKMLLTVGVSPATLPAPDRNARTDALRDAYIVELAAGLSKRTGNNLTRTAMTLLLFLPKDAQSSTAVMRELRPPLIQQFDTVDAYYKELLLGVYWEQFRDPGLIPSLKQMLVPGDQRMRQLALTRLIELAPDEARSYIIAEICDPNSYIDPQILSGLSDEKLPELDSILRRQVLALATAENPDYVRLKFKTALVARYATGGIYRELMELYRTAGTKLSLDARVGLLAYFAKHKAREGVVLLEQAVSESKPEESAMLIVGVGALYYSEPLDVLVKKYLETGDVMLASSAASVIGLRGAAGDREVLEARLKRWRDEWANRIEQANAEHQGQIERELIYALVHGKAWKLSEQYTLELRRSCLSQICKQSNL